MGRYLWKRHRRKGGHLFVEGGLALLEVLDVLGTLYVPYTALYFLVI